HFRNGINADYAAVGSHDIGDAQSRLPWPGGDVENRMSGFDLSIAEERLSYRRKHASNGFPVLVPIRRRSAPRTKHVFVLVHRVSPDYGPITCGGSIKGRIPNFG